MILFFSCLFTTQQNRQAGNNTLINKNKAAHLKNQLGGHFSLGSSSRRNKVQRAQIISMQMPHINADCGGIDIFLGGFSYINEQQLIDLLKNIGSAAKSYAFMLALETVSPQIASNIKYLQELAQKVNLANINSCEAAAALVGSVAPRASRISENTCKLMSANRGHMTDFVVSRKGCGEQGSQRERSKDIIRDQLGDVVGEETNIAWHVMKKHEGWTKELKETVMSVTGTVITKADGEVVSHEPLALDDDFFTAFAEGGLTTVYQCNDSRCLTVSKITRLINPDENHAAKVRELLVSIEDKIYSDTPLSEAEKTLIEDCQVPILKIINIMSAYHRGDAPINIQSYADIIAHDLLNKHIKDLVAIVYHLATNMRGVQLNDESLRRYLKQVRAVQQKLENREIETHNNIDQIFKIIEKTQVLEKSIYANMRVIASGG